MKPITNEYEKRVFKAADEPDWTHVADISRRTGMNTNTISKYCGILAAKGLLEERILGVYKLYRHKEDGKRRLKK